jgi:predicted outer membrane protein
VRPVESSSIRVRAAQLLPAQVSNLQQLSTSRGRGFDSLYVSTTKAALVQLQTLYREFIGQTGVDPGLQAIAERELPKVEQTISSLDAL